MSDPAAIGLGIGLGFLIAVPVFFAYRHEMALSLRRLCGTSAEAEGEGSRNDVPRESKPTVAPSRRRRGASPVLSGTVVWFSTVAGILTIVIGAVLGNVLAIISGIVLAFSLLAATILSRVVRN